MTTYAYDAIGNQISVDNNHKALQKVVSEKRAFCYNEDNQLVKQTNEITYLYDAKGLLMAALYGSDDNLF